MAFRASILVFLIGSTLVLASGGSAQSPQLYGRRIVEVVVAGTAARTTRPRDIGIPINARLSRRLLRNTIQQLIGTGRWADVQLDATPVGEDVRLTARLIPRLLLNRVDVVGNDVLDDDEILRELQLHEGTEIERADLGTLAAQLKSVYAERGYEAMSADLELRDTDDPARKVMIVRVRENEPTRVLGIRFDGDAPPPGSGVRRAMGLSSGDIYDQREVDEAVRKAEGRLREAGWLEARVGPVEILRRPAGVLIALPSHVGPRYTLRIVTPDPLDRSRVFDEMDVFDERLSRGRIRAIQDRIVDLYQRRGFNDARVRLHIVPNRRHRDRAELVVEIRAGHQLRVVARAFPGARHFDQSFLESQMGSFLDEAIAANSILDPVDTDTANRIFARNQDHDRETPRPPDTNPLQIWYPSAYERAIEHVQGLYEAEGFLDARVGPARLETVGRHRAIVVVPVSEGPRALLHGVQLRGHEALTTQEVLEAAALERDQPFSYFALEQAKSRIVEAYQDRGYYYASVDTQVRFSGDRTRAEVLMQVSERFEVHVGDITIEGNDTTNERLIRRVLTIGEGDLLRPAALRSAQDALLNLGVFTSVSVAPQNPDLPERVKPLTVSIVEQDNQYLDFRAGVSTAQGARFGLEYGYRNLGGTAIGFRLSGQIGYQFIFFNDPDNVLQDRFESLSLQDRLERRVALTFDIPFIGLPNVRTSLAGIHQRENERNFGFTKNSVDLTFGWRPHRSVSTQFSADVENNDVEVLGDESYEEILQQVAGNIRLRNLLRVPEGETTLVAGRAFVSLDRRDNPFVPKRGFFVSASAEWARTLTAEEIERAGELQRFFSHHMRVQLTASGYVPLDRRERFVFATQLKLGRVIHLEDNSETYPNRSFFVGGVGTVRGYLQDAMVPQDLADEIQDNPELFDSSGIVQGGDTFMVLRGELRFPIVGDLNGGLFVDLGNLWIEPPLNPLDLRPTAGFGLRFGTPVGPIAFDLGFLLAPRDYLGEETFGSFHFSIGLF